MAATPSFPMPFATVPCSVWLPVQSAEDAYGNVNHTYASWPDWTGRCVYSPSRTRYEQTANDFEEGRPHGSRVTLTVYLPKSFSLPLRGAQLAVYPPDDRHLYGKRFDVDGEPYSYMRANTPGDYSWQVEAVAHDG